MITASIDLSSSSRRKSLTNSGRLPWASSSWAPVLARMASSRSQKALISAPCLMAARASCFPWLRPPIRPSAIFSLAPSAREFRFRKPAATAALLVSRNVLRFWLISLLIAQRVYLCDTIIAALAKHQENQIAFCIVHHGAVLAGFWSWSIKRNRGAAPGVIGRLPKPKAVAIGEKSVLARQIYGLAGACGCAVGGGGSHVPPLVRGEVESPQFVAPEAAAMQDKLVAFRVISQAGQLVQILRRRIALVIEALPTVFRRAVEIDRRVLMRTRGAPRPLITGIVQPGRPVHVNAHNSARRRDNGIDTRRSRPCEFPFRGLRIEDPGEEPDMRRRRPH